MKTLINNVTIITSQRDNMVINNGYIYIDGQYIKDIGSSDEAEKLDLIAREADRVINGRGYIAMPGLVNAHTHSPMTLLRNYGSDLNLQDWLYTKIFPKEAMFTDADVYYGSLLGIEEMISTGTPCFVDMYYMMDNVARAVLDWGIRANIAVGPFNNDFSSGSRVTRENFEYTDEFIKNWNGNADGRIRVSLEVHPTYLYDISVLSKAAEYAEKKGIGIHIHLHETRKEIEDSLREHGKRPVELCWEAGIFNVPVFAAHCVHLDERDMAILAEGKASVVHNPTSNLKLASGIARIPDIIKKGINTALGTDGAASNNNLNMMEEMHLAAILHKGISGDPADINAAEAIIMATSNGSKAIGFEKGGRLEAGMLADIILLDTSSLHFTPINDPLGAVAYTAQGGDVDTVIINGELVYENREFKTIDIEYVKYMFNKRYERLFNNE